MLPWPETALKPDPCWLDLGPLPGRTWAPPFLPDNSQCPFCLCLFFLAPRPASRRSATAPTAGEDKGCSVPGALQLGSGSPVSRAAALPCPEVATSQPRIAGEAAGSRDIAGFQVGTQRPRDLEPCPARGWFPQTRCCALHGAASRHPCAKAQENTPGGRQAPHTPRLPPQRPGSSSLSIQSDGLSVSPSRLDLFQGPSLSLLSSSLPPSLASLHSLSTNYFLASSPSSPHP